MAEEERISPSKSRTRRPTLKRYRIAAQPHLYTRPLIYHLDRSAEASLSVISPPSLADKLLCCELDAALIPSIDLQTVSGLTVVPAGCVSCSGRTLATRIFSRVRPALLETLWVDPQSHTSTILAQVLWSHCFNTRLDILPYDEDTHQGAEDMEALLLVGDKVVTHPPLGFDWQIDLGLMWYEMTGLPFVFNVWAAADPADCESLYRILSQAKQLGTQNLDEIAHQHASEFDWPADLAIQSLKRHLQFDFGDAQREGMEEFFSLAAECGAIDEHIPVRCYNPRTDGL